MSSFDPVPIGTILFWPNKGCSHKASGTAFQGNPASSDFSFQVQREACKFRQENSTMHSSLYPCHQLLSLTGPYA